MENISSIIIINLAILWSTNLNSTKMNKPINENAPVVEKQHILIPESPQRVWEILSDIDKWPEWQSEVTQAEITGEVQEGTVFKWKAGGISFTSKLHTVLESQAIGWTGKTFGTRAVHNWRLEKKNGGTMVYVEESLEGFLPKLLKKSFSKNLHEGMKKNLNELSSACTN